jgi:hypothetical protein
VLRATAQEFDRRLFHTLADALGLDVSSTDPERVRIAELLWGEVEDSEIFGALPGGPELRYRIVDIILALALALALAERLASATPTVLVIEDLQWADHSTLLGPASEKRTPAAHRVAPRGDVSILANEP